MYCSLVLSEMAVWSLEITFPAKIPISFMNYLSVDSDPLFILCLSTTCDTGIFCILVQIVMKNIQNSLFYDLVMTLVTGNMFSLTLVGMDCCRTTAKKHKHQTKDVLVARILGKMLIVFVKNIIKGHETFFCLNCDDWVKFKENVLEQNWTLYDQEGYLRINM